MTGLVQGVGFRPFVWREATRLGLSGFVGNDSGGVFIEAEGPASAVDALLTALSSPPPLARVDSIRPLSVFLVGDPGFVIHASEVDGARTALIALDTATCEDCLRELHAPADRRYRYPFINCTSCGPRYSIVESVPYDRFRTTMAPFPMCAECRAEYEDPASRRFHAEPICCWACGPSLSLVGHAGDPVAETVALLRAGAVVAIKGIGGYHLAVDARSEAAVAKLRSRKHREDRPFALMVPSVEAARTLCTLGELELALLTSAARPIVVLRSHSPDVVAASVSPRIPTLGLMLPYTPLHALLLEAFDAPLVMTSGNASDEPIAFQDDDASRRLIGSGIADAVLTHNRAIRTRVDDSVVKVAGDRIIPMRRSRGYAPTPIHLPFESSEVVLGMGAQLKNTFCVTRGDQAFMSHHIGDLTNYETYESYVDGIDHMLDLLDVTPTVIAHDLHPDFPSTRYGIELAERFGSRLVGVQHHYAHILSCMVDNGIRPEDGKVLGVAFDGFGLGCDGGAWGGEFLLCGYNGFERVAHLEEVPMPGGDIAVREPWRMALAWLDKAYDGDIPQDLGVVQRNADRWDQVLSLSRSRINSPITSSVGRLFDAVASILGIRDVVTYEGQAAIELEHAGDANNSGSYDVPIFAEGAGASCIVRALTDELLNGRSAQILASRFHQTFAYQLAKTCCDLRDRASSDRFVISGGAAANSVLLQATSLRLQNRKLPLMSQQRAPSGDGGISLGQVAAYRALKNK